MYMYMYLLSILVKRCLCHKYNDYYFILDGLDWNQVAYIMQSDVESKLSIFLLVLLLLLWKACGEMHFMLNYGPCSTFTYLYSIQTWLYLVEGRKEMHECAVWKEGMLVFRQSTLNSLLHQIILDLSKFKHFADDKLHCISRSTDEIFSWGGRGHRGWGRVFWITSCSPFPSMFFKTLFSWIVKIRIAW